MQYYSRDSVEQSLSMSTAVQLSKVAFELQSHGMVVQAVRNIIPSSDGKLMGTMPAYITNGKYAGFGLKSIVVDFSKENTSPSHVGTILLFDESNSSQISAVDASSITELRTAAASAWATHVLAPPEASRLAILGTGLQARQHLLAMLEIRPIRQITIWGRNRIHTQHFEDWCKEHTDAEITSAATPSEAVREADIICTVTAAKKPFLLKSDLPERCHINAVGASAIGFQELDPEIYSDIELYVDSRESSWNASQCLISAKEKGFIPHGYIIREIGEIEHIPDSSKSQIPKQTLFKSVGLAVQDLVFAREVIQQHQ